MTATATEPDRADEPTLVSDQHQRQPTLLGHGLWMFSVSRLLSYGCPFFRFLSSHLASSRPRFFSQRPSSRFLVVEPCQPRPNESLARGPCSRMTRRPGVWQYRSLTPVWLHMLHSIEVHFAYIFCSRSVTVSSGTSLSGSHQQTLRGGPVVLCAVHCIWNWMLITNSPYEKSLEKAFRHHPGLTVCG